MRLERKGNRKPQTANRKPQKRGLIFVISGPSGSGKTTLLNKILKSPGLKNKLVKSVSATTRPKRTGEREGRDYFFISQRRFRELLGQKKILEWTRYLGYYYATPRDFLDAQFSQGKNLILCLDHRGALSIQRFCPKNTITIFIAPPSLEDLGYRIRKRCSKTAKAEIKERLKLAQEELRNQSQYNYCLVNQDLATTLRRLEEIILSKILERKDSCPTFH